MRDLGLEDVETLLELLVFFAQVRNLVLNRGKRLGLSFEILNVKGLSETECPLSFTILGRALLDGFASRASKELIRLDLVIKRKIRVNLG